MKSLLINLLVLIPILSYAQDNTLKLNGAIGSYEIEVELSPNSNSNRLIEGKYRYKGKTAYLDLEAKLYTRDLLYMQEFYNGESTGEFFLSHEEGNWMGKWTNGKKAFEVNLIAVDGNLLDFFTFDKNEVSSDINDKIDGTYSSGEYFINDYFFTEDNPTIEIGYNGGTVSVNHIHTDSIKVELETVSGPTYHIAAFGGVAVKIDHNKFEYNGSLYDEDEKCHLTFTFDDNGGVSINQLSTNMACGFGMRAYAGGDFQKFKNEVESIGY